MHDLRLAVLMAMPVYIEMIHVVVEAVQQEDICCPVRTLA